MRTGFNWRAFVLLAIVAGTLAAQSRRSREQAAAPFDYYVLSLSWAPEFCSQADATARSPEECMPGRMTGFVVHGLWPQANAGRGPESCGTAGRVSRSVVDYVIRYMPSPGLIQHEWATHGVCTGLTPAEYFGAVVETRAAVQIPVQFASIEGEKRESPQQIETQFASANPSFPREAFRTSCARGDLQEVRVCFDKDRKPRACTASAGECPIPAIRIRPPS
jgi:ribonuclease T2